MSRGHGRIQRAIIVDLMEFPHLTVDDLGLVIYRVETLTDRHRDTIRRALKKLEAEGLVKRSSAVDHLGWLTWKFVGTRADHTDERLTKLRKRIGRARKPRLVKV
jgi:predicted transcriptional regulator